MGRRRRGRPGLVGTMARTAVVAGTATAVVGHSQNKQANKAQAQQDQQAAYESQAQVADMQQQMDQMQAQQAAPAAAPPPAAGGDDMIAKLGQLGDLHSAGILSDAEFASAKAKLLA